MARVRNAKFGMLTFVPAFQLRLVYAPQLPPLHYLDATSAEEAATPLRLLVMYSFPAHATPRLQGMRLLGAGEIGLPLVKSLIQVCAYQKYL
jgi:hypothetical protein